MHEDLANEILVSDVCEELHQVALLDRSAGSSREGQARVSPGPGELTVVGPLHLAASSESVFGDVNQRQAERKVWFARELQAQDA
jgi:hypothetical protein